MELNDSKINSKYLKVKSITLDYQGKKINYKTNKSVSGFLEWFGKDILNAMTYTPKKNDKRK